jgi:DNA-binding transcriptional LysR family regulator
MTVRHLRIFLEVYREMNVTRAAEKLHMTQPAVTRAIQEIERHYGVLVFERLKGRISVTEGGRALYSYAVHIAETFDRMEKAISNWDSAGILRVGASITIGNYMLIDFVKSFQGELPGMRVQVLIGAGLTLQQALIDNELDLALVEGEAEFEELISEPFASDRLVPIFPAGHPLLSKRELLLSDVARCPLLLREEGSAGRAFLDSVFEARGHAVRPLWESASTQALIRAVAAGLGISILPEQLVRADVDSGAVCAREIADADFSRRFNIIRHKNKFIADSARRFMEICKAVS